MIMQIRDEHNDITINFVNHSKSWSKLSNTVDSGSMLVLNSLHVVVSNKLVTTFFGSLLKSVLTECGNCLGKWTIS